MWPLRNRKRDSGKKGKAQRGSPPRPIEDEVAELRRLLETALQQLEDERQAARQQAETARQREEAERSARQAAEQQAETARWREEAERNARQAAEQQAATDRQQAEAERRIRLATQQLNEGTYYATFDEVWDAVGEPFAPSHYEAMIRDEFPSYTTATGDRRWTSHFEITMDCAKEPIYDVAIGKRSIASSKASSRSSRDPDWNQKTWPVDALHSRFPHRGNSDLLIQIREASEDSQQSNIETTPDDAQIAHLVPASDVFAALYHHVAIWVFGVELDKRRDSRFVQKLIHGSIIRRTEPITEQSTADAKAPSKKRLPTANRSLKNPIPVQAMSATESFQPQPTEESEQDSTSVNRSVIGSAGSEGNSRASNAIRAKNTGLKHMICNKVRVPGQWNYFDNKPCLIIVPVLSLEQAKNWKGEGYDALFMISRGAKTIDGQPLPNGTTLQSLDIVAARVGLMKFGLVANESEIECARKLLTATLKGLAFSLKEKSADTENWVSALSEASNAALEKLRNAFEVVDSGKNVIIPHCQKRNNNKPVPRITFAPAFGPLGNDGHPAPDPLLLVVKAAVNWSKFHEQPLMAAGEIGESDYDTNGSSITAMEEYLGLPEDDEDACRHEEIMKMGEIQFPNHLDTDP